MKLVFLSQNAPTHLLADYRHSCVSLPCIPEFYLLIDFRFCSSTSLSSHLYFSFLSSQTLWISFILHSLIFISHPSSNTSEFVIDGFKETFVVKEKNTLLLKWRWISHHPWFLIFLTSFFLLFSASNKISFSKLHLN